MKQLGATIVDPVDFHTAIAQAITAYEPSSFTQVFPEVRSGARAPLRR
jgi:hypothetical protein